MRSPKDLSIVGMTSIFAVTVLLAMVFFPRNTSEAQAQPSQSQNLLVHLGKQVSYMELNLNGPLASNAGKVDDEVVDFAKDHKVLVLSVQVIYTCNYSMPQAGCNISGVFVTHTPLSDNPR